VNQLLGSLWFPRVCYPELFDDDLQDVVTEYYSIMYGYDLTDEEYEELTAHSIPAELEEDAA
jgi:iron complex transport system substrate-binding protein